MLVNNPRNWVVLNFGLNLKQKKLELVNYLDMDEALQLKFHLFSQYNIFNTTCHFSMLLNTQFLCRGLFGAIFNIVTVDIFPESS